MDPRLIITGAPGRAHGPAGVGDPIQIDGITVIPAATVAGGGGGGRGEAGERGAGFGVRRWT